MNDHQGIKWAPFNSVINGKKVLTSIMKEKNKIAKPILSEDQIQELENKIINAYNQNAEVELIYYKSGTNSKISRKITKLDAINNKIILNYHSNLYFNNIIDIFEKNT